MITKKNNDLRKNEHDDDQEQDDDDTNDKFCLLNPAFFCFSKMVVENKGKKQESTTREKRWKNKQNIFIVCLY